MTKPKWITLDDREVQLSTIEYYKREISTEMNPQAKLTLNLTSGRLLAKAFQTDKDMDNFIKTHIRS